MKKNILIIAVLLSGLFVTEAEAAIAFRAASYAGARQPTISYQATGTVASAASGNVTPTLSSISQNNFFICLVEQHDNVAISFPAGWTQLYSLSTTTTHRASAFYKLSAAAETNPVITHTGGNSIIAQCSTFRGVDAADPLDVAYAAQYAASSISVTSGSVTTLTANDMMLFAPHIANNPLVSLVPTGAGGVTWSQRFYSSTALGLHSTVGLYSGTKATAGAVGPITLSILLAAENHGVLMALHNASTLSIAVPAGTVAGDVMIAAITVTPSTVPITAPGGWTQIRAVTQASGGGSQLATYYRVATASEPASYTWTLTTSHTGAAGGIVSYSGVDNTTPIDVSASVITNSSLNHTAPTITTSIANDMLVTVHEYESASSWTPPGGMTERVDIASRAVSSNGITLEMNELVLGAAGATGAKTATAAGNNKDSGATASIALRAALLQPHHIEIDHAGLGCTTLANNVTVKACGDAACSNGGLITTGVSVTLSPGGNVVVIGASGTGTGTVSSVTAGTVALGASSSPAALNTRTCINTISGVADCNFTFQSSGFSIAVPGGVSATSVTGTIVACAAPFTGAKTINFYTGYSNPASGTKSATINGTTIATSSPGTGVNLTFNASSQATFTLAYPDVGLLNLNAGFTGPPVLTGVTSFIMKPAGFVLSNIKQTAAPNTANPGAITASGAAFVKAGEYFGITVTAVNSLGVTTPNFGQAIPPDVIQFTPSLVAGLGLIHNPSVNKATTGNISNGSNALTVGSSAGYAVGDRIRVAGAGVAGADLNTSVTAVPNATSLTLAATAGTTVSGAVVHYLLNAFSNGVATGDHFMWDEVGIITIMPSIADGSYMTAGNVIGDAAGNPSGPVGRFILAKFSLQKLPSDDRADLCQLGVLVADGVTPCSSIFTYMGEEIDAEFTLVPQSLNNLAVQNYLGQNGASDFAKLDPTVFANLNLAAVDRTTVGQPYYLTARVGNTGMPVITCASVPCFTSAGADITLPFAFSRNATADGAYTAVDYGIAPLDADGAPVDAVGTAGTGTCNNTTVAACYDLDTNATAGNDHAKIDTTSFRYGRLNVSNVFGSEQLPLPVPVNAQYWNGSSFVTNVDDNLTPLLTTNIVLGTYRRSGTDAWTTSVSALSSTGTAMWKATLAKPVGTITGRGSVDVSTNAPSYLPSNSPPSRATFGVYKGSNEFIYMREAY
jgi:hypothetical protein